jgi:benzoyl-CoA reductase/2-hydroxyglutaryl-CoA dehydratase subunit BcrC/BadD/HgdB
LREQSNVEHSFAGEGTAAPPGIGQLARFLADAYRAWPRRYPAHRAFGYVCTYAPLELLHAAGFAPVRLLQLSSPVTVSSGPIPSFSCSLARAVTERLVCGELDFFSGVLFGHTCDTVQCLADIWQMARPRFPVLTYSAPTAIGAAHAHAYALAGLHQLVNDLRDASGSALSERSLRRSIAQYNAQRRLLAELHERRSRITTEEWWLWSALAAVLPIEEHSRLLQSWLHGLDSSETREAGPPVFLVGAMIDEPLIPRLIDELGGRVVGDDLCTGSRCCDLFVDEGSDPLAALVQRYLRRASCPVKHGAAESRALRLLRLVKQADAQGVVFVLPKFCDPHAFDYVSISDLLDHEGVPHTLIETEVATPPEQVRTRLQAFFELMQL